MPGKWALLPDGSAVHATDTIIVIEPDEDLEGVELATGRGSGAPLIVKRVSQDSSIGQLRLVCPEDRLVIVNGVSTAGLSPDAVAAMVNADVVTGGPPNYCVFRSSDLDNDDAPLPSQMLTVEQLKDEQLWGPLSQSDKPPCGCKPKDVIRYWKINQREGKLCVYKTADDAVALEKPVQQYPLTTITGAVFGFSASGSRPREFIIMFAKGKEVTLGAANHELARSWVSKLRLLCGLVRPEELVMRTAPIKRRLFPSKVSNASTLSDSKSPEPSAAAAAKRVGPHVEVDEEGNFSDDEPDSGDEDEYEDEEEGEGFEEDGKEGGEYDDDDGGDDDVDFDDDDGVDLPEVSRVPSRESAKTPAFEAQVVSGRTPSVSPPAPKQPSPPGPKQPSPPAPPASATVPGASPGLSLIGGPSPQFSGLYGPTSQDSIGRGLSPDVSRVQTPLVELVNARKPTPVRIRPKVNTTTPSPTHSRSTSRSRSRSRGHTPTSTRAGSRGAATAAQGTETTTPRPVSHKRGRYIGHAPRIDIMTPTGHRYKQHDIRVRPIQMEAVQSGSKVAVKSGYGLVLTETPLGVVITEVTPADMLVMPGSGEGVAVARYPDCTTTHRIPLDRGVQAGDVIIAVNFESMQGKSVREVHQLMQKCASSYGVHLRVAREAPPSPEPASQSNTATPPPDDILSDDFIRSLQLPEPGPWTNLEDVDDVTVLPVPTLSQLAFAKALSSPPSRKKGDPDASFDSTASGFRPDDGNPAVAGPPKPKAPEAKPRTPSRVSPNPVPQPRPQQPAPSASGQSQSRGHLRPHSVAHPSPGSRIPVRKDGEAKEKERKEKESKERESKQKERRERSVGRTLPVAKKPERTAGRSPVPQAEPGEEALLTPPVTPDPSLPSSLPSSIPASLPSSSSRSRTALPVKRGTHRSPGRVIVSQLVKKEAGRNSRRTSGSPPGARRSPQKALSPSVGKPSPPRPSPYAQDRLRRRSENSTGSKGVGVGARADPEGSTEGWSVMDVFAARGHYTLSEMEARIITPSPHSMALQAAAAVTSPTRSSSSSSSSSSSPSPPPPAPVIPQDTVNDLFGLSDSAPVSPATVEEDSIPPPPPPAVNAPASISVAAPPAIPSPRIDLVTVDPAATAVVSSPVVNTAVSTSSPSTRMDAVVDATVTVPSPSPRVDVVAPVTVTAADAGSSSSPASAVAAVSVSTAPVTAVPPPPSAEPLPQSSVNDLFGVADSAPASPASVKSDAVPPVVPARTVGAPAAPSTAPSPRVDAVVTSSAPSPRVDVAAPQAVSVGLSTPRLDASPLAGNSEADKANNEKTTPSSSRNASPLPVPPTRTASGSALLKGLSSPPSTSSSTSAFTGRATGGGKAGNDLLEKMRAAMASLDTARSIPVPPPKPPQ